MALSSVLMRVMMARGVLAGANNPTQELEIRKGKTIGIELASFKKGDHYQLYHFDENNNWNINGTFTAGANTRKINRLKELGITDTTTKSDIVFDGC